MKVTIIFNGGKQGEEDQQITTYKLKGTIVGDMHGL
jgi:hypothetical protein